MARSGILVLLLAFCLLAVTVTAKKAKAAKKTEEQPAPAPAEPAPEQPNSSNADNEEVNNDEHAASEEKEEKEQEAAPEEHDKDQEEEQEAPKENEEEQAPEAKDKDAEQNEEEEETEESAPPAAFKCNLKYQRVGCYKDKAKKERPLRDFIMSSSNVAMAQKKSGSKQPSSKDFDSGLPEFACKCANEALDRGNAVFGIQNLAECWTGPDNSKFDADGASEDCVTFGFQQCMRDSELCAGKKHANFVYFVDSPDHTKSPEEAKKEWAAIRKAQKKLEEERRKAAAKAAKAASAKAKKGKKGKKGSKKHH